MKKQVLIRGFLVAALAFFSFLMLRLSLPYTNMNSGVDFLQTKQNVYHLDHWRISFYTHVFTSIFVLIAGFTQFNPWILKHHKLWHRRMGYLYILIVVFVTGPSAFIMGLYANGGLPARASFTVLAALWIIFTALAWNYALKGRFQTHGAFMIRSYALTLSAITLRLYTIAFHMIGAEASPKDIYITTAWLSWVPNLILAEILIRNGVVKKIFNQKPVISSQAVH